MQSKLLRVNTSKLLAHSQQLGEKQKRAVPIIPDTVQDVIVLINLNKQQAPTDAIVGDRCALSGSMNFNNLFCHTMYHGPTELD